MRDGRPFISLDHPELDPRSASCLCAICDQPVQLSEAAIATHRSHGMEVAYICHEYCLLNDDDDWDDEEDEEDEEE